MPNWILEYFTTARGDNPVRDYLDALPATEAAKADYELDLLEEFGIQLGPPHIKRLTGTELWELRIRAGNQHRILYVALTGQRFLLLHAFAKKQQQTPRNEIRTAQRRLREYRQRFGG